MDLYGNKKALDELSKIYMNLDEISADTALAASKEADKKRGQLAAAGDREGAAKKAKQAATLYKKQADKRLNRESISNWRDDLREVISDVETTQSPKPNSEVVVKEKNVKNKVVIDPEVKLEDVEKAVGGKVISIEEKMTTAALEDTIEPCPDCGEPKHEGECVAEEQETTVEESILWDRVAVSLDRLSEISEAQELPANIAAALSRLEKKRVRQGGDKKDSPYNAHRGKKLHPSQGKWVGPKK
tara:strand:- start:89 stop:820 length:732 start_codon:yes stop_codon:yes gene_type:complete